MIGNNGFLKSDLSEKRFTFLFHYISKIFHSRYVRPNMSQVWKRVMKDENFTIINVHFLTGKYVEDNPPSCYSFLSLSPHINQVTPRKRFGSSLSTIFITKLSALASFKVPLASADLWDGFISGPLYMSVAGLYLHCDKLLDRTYYDVDVVTNIGWFNFNAVHISMCSDFPKNYRLRYLLLIKKHSFWEKPVMNWRLDRCKFEKLWINRHAQ